MELPHQLGITLFSPRIPANVGAVGRLCAATQTPLHLIRPLGFSFTDQSLQRSGLDYFEHVEKHLHNSFGDFMASAGERRVWLFTTHGERLYWDAEFSPTDFLLFGNEPHGVTEEIRAAIPRERHVIVPMPSPHGRSLNLATTVGIALYEALRQVRKRTSSGSA
ncbi:MAG: tRNA (cytidine(34)-2'-O)-methyltransferase [Candidatus Sumerlaeia bacterium]|nr:tRNA (cytidine(34)-2'-O)-methyltransferase [Candidatus Sumerlaeia bacterium]